MWQEKQRSGTPLERVRARQIEEIAERGQIPYEVPELTQAILQESWLKEGAILFVFLSGEQVGVPL